MLDDVKAVVFDFDGVILESADIKTEAYHDLFADRPEHQSAIVKYHLQNLGVSRFEKIRWVYRELLGEDLHPCEAERLAERFSELVFQRVLSCEFVPGALDLLRQLEGRIDCYVASGTPQSELDVIVDRRGLRRFFTAVWGAPRSKTDILTSLVSALHLAPQQLLFIGDGRSDFDAAEATGVRFLARSTPATLADWRSLAVATVPDLSPLVSVEDGAGVASRAGGQPLLRPS